MLRRVVPENDNPLKKNPNSQKKSSLETACRKGLTGVRRLGAGKSAGVLSYTVFCKEDYKYLLITSVIQLGSGILVILLRSHSFGVIYLRSHLPDYVTVMWRV